jgi:hypothetical protein
LLERKQFRLQFAHLACLSLDDSDLPRLWFQNFELQDSQANIQVFTSGGEKANASPHGHGASSIGDRQSLRLFGCQLSAAPLHYQSAAAYAAYYLIILP